jgi:large subunit ribosomal protein L24
MAGRRTMGQTARKKTQAPGTHNGRVHVVKGDRVKVIRGNFKGQEGTVLRVVPQDNRVVIEGINLRKRHMKPTQENPEGGIVSFEAPIHASNVMLLDPTTSEPTRTRKHLDEDGTKERVSVKSGNAIPKPKH